MTHFLVIEEFCRVVFMMILNFVFFDSLFGPVRYARNDTNSWSKVASGHYHRLNLMLVSLHHAPDPIVLAHKNQILFILLLLEMYLKHCMDKLYLFQDNHLTFDVIYLQALPT